MAAFNIYSIHIPITMVWYVYMIERGVGSLDRSGAKIFRLFFCRQARGITAWPFGVSKAEFIWRPATEISFLMEGVSE
jgi:hypothetical protein